jgi:tetratricopeptide (TPR) repeat protein
MAYRIRKKAEKDSNPEPSAPPQPPRSFSSFSGPGPSRNAWGFAGAILLVILIGIGVVYHIHSDKTKMESAAAALETKAEQLYSRGQQTNGSELVQAKQDFEEVMRKYKDSKSARIAPLFLASIENIQTPGNSSKALVWLHQGLDMNAGNMKLLPFYYESMGVTLMSAHQYDQALAMFQKVIAFPDKILADAALFNIGKIYENLNQPALAIVNYKKLVKEFPSSPWAAESEPFLMKNGITPPATTSPAPLAPK